ncbi:MAG: acetolactate synthase small subunit, partial [Candidatus Omnitrophica bacterium]|nr:acetolactate synthase small subunit [Candidatus Omnitrophota bacterium]
IKVSPQTKAPLAKQAKKHHAKITDETDHFMIIEQAGTTDQLDAFEDVLKKYGIVEIVRSGKLTMAVGKVET